MNVEQGDELKFWAIVELMGHSRMAGFITTVSIGGTSFVRVEVPGDGEDSKPYTRFVNPQAIYALNPCDEATAREAAKAFRPEPVHRWELPALPSPSDEVQTIRQQMQGVLPGYGGFRDDCDSGGNGIPDGDGDDEL